MTTSQSPQVEVVSIPADGAEAGKELVARLLAQGYKVAGFSTYFDDNAWQRIDRVLMVRNPPPIWDDKLASLPEWLKLKAKETDR